MVLRRMEEENVQKPPSTAKSKHSIKSCRRQNNVQAMVILWEQQLGYTALVLGSSSEISVAFRFSWRKGWIDSSHVFDQYPGDV